MFLTFYKLIIVFTINLIISVPLYAQAVEKKALNFDIQAEGLLKGEIHYYHETITPRKLAIKYPEMFDLDALSLTQESNVMMVVTKSVSIANRPVGFFDDSQMNEEKFVAHILGEQKVKKTGPDIFRVTVPSSGLKYRMQTYFDSDDISTLPNSKVTRAVTAAKKLDVISQSASTIMFTEKTSFSKYAEGGVSVSSFIPLKENKTIVITYNLTAVKKKFALENVLKSNFLREIEATRDLIESYK
jgi:hypothetical protein